MLTKLLDGRLIFTPMADGTAVEFRGAGVLDPVLSGIVDAGGIPKTGGPSSSRITRDSSSVSSRRSDCCAITPAGREPFAGFVLTHVDRRRVRIQAGTASLL